MLMKKSSRTILHLILILVCSVAAGYLLLVAVYCIPQSRLFLNLANSVAAIQKDDADLSEVITGYPGSRLDVFTDGAMLNTALHTNDDGPFKRAIACYQYKYKDRSPAQGFTDFFIPKDPDGELLYIRYWHGFLVVLKPLLLFFNYSDIRMLNHMGQMLLVFLNLYALIRRKLHRYIPAVLITYFFLTPVTLPLAMQYSSVFYIGFLSLACLILFYDKLSKGEGLLILFLLTGVLTSYMDLLTYPVFTLGLPLAGLLILRGEDDKEEKDFMPAFKEFVSCGVTWFLGYALMWAAKTVIAIPFYGISAIGDTLSSVSGHTVPGAVKGGYTYLEALKNNLSMYKNRVYILCLIVYTIVVLIFAIIKKGKGTGKTSLNHIPMFLCITAIPFVWYLGLTEHSCVHSFMTYKDLTVAVFGYCACIASLLPRKDIQ